MNYFIFVIVSEKVSGAETTTCDMPLQTCHRIESNYIDGCWINVYPTKATHHQTSISLKQTNILTPTSLCSLGLRSNTLFFISFHSQMFVFPFCFYVLYVRSFSQSVILSVIHFYSFNCSSFQCFYILISVRLYFYSLCLSVGLYPEMRH